MTNDHDLASLRRDYAGKELLEDQMHQDPFDQFARWFSEALDADVTDPNAMTLATAAPGGAPSVRVVLLKGFDGQGFRFFTNLKSRKAVELTANPNGALCFYWDALIRQVRIEGAVAPLPRAEAEAYFQSRPRESQVAAWASEQSAPLENRQALMDRFKQLQDRFGDSDDIPMPEFWGGFLLRPRRFEFWQGRPGRLHDRIAYARETEEASWNMERLSP